MPNPAETIATDGELEVILSGLSVRVVVVGLVVDVVVAGCSVVVTVVVEWTVEGSLTQPQTKTNARIDTAHLIIQYSPARINNSIWHRPVRGVFWAPASQAPWLVEHPPCVGVNIYLHPPGPILAPLPGP